MEGFGALQVMSRDEMVRQAEEHAKRAMETRQGDAVLSNLAALLRKWWEAAKDAKEPVQEKMLKSLRQRKGEYDPDVLAQIMAAGGGQTLFMRLTDEKCNAAIAWLEEILLPPDDKPWATKPTPVPDLPPSEAHRIAAQVTGEALAMAQMGQMVGDNDVRERAKQLAKQSLEALSKFAREEEERVEREIEDQLVEAGWRDAFREVLDDVVTYPCGFLKGPLPIMEDTLEWAEQGPVLQQRATKKYVRVSPFDIYPSPMSRSIQDGYLIEKHLLTRRDLKALEGVPGYDSEAIRQVLLEASDTGLGSWTTADDDTRQSLEGRDDYERDPEGRIEALQVWGWVQGKLLREWGMDEAQVPDETAEYSVEAWLIDRWVIKAELNGDKRGFRPYYKASFRERVGSFWGEGLPDIIADSQEACNAAARNLLGNMAIASGPQVGVDMAALAEGETPSAMYPWKIWTFDMEAKQTTGDPIWFFQPNPVIEQLLKVYEFFSVEADNKTGIPRYAYGTQGANQGALGTASGLSMMLNAATKGIKKVVGNLDTNIIAPSVEGMFFSMMLENPGQYRGDIKLVARGASGLIEKQQMQVRRNEFLAMALGNKSVLGLIGMKGLAALLRAHVRDLSIDAEDVVPTPEEIEAKELAQQVAQQQMLAQGGLPQGNAGGAISAPKKLDAAGNPVAGQDQRLMQRLPIRSDAQATGPAQ